MLELKFILSWGVRRSVIKGLETSYSYFNNPFEDGHRQSEWQHPIWYLWMIYFGDTSELLETSPTFFHFYIEMERMLFRLSIIVVYYENLQYVTF